MLCVFQVAIRTVSPGEGDVQAQPSAPIGQFVTSPPYHYATVRTNHTTRHSQSITTCVLRTGAAHRDALRDILGWQSIPKCLPTGPKAHPHALRFSGCHPDRPHAEENPHGPLRTPWAIENDTQVNGGKAHSHGHAVSGPAREATHRHSGTARNSRNGMQQKNRTQSNKRHAAKEPPTVQETARSKRTVRSSTE